jgi:hypothetical protein
VRYAEAAVAQVGQPFATTLEATARTVFTSSEWLKILTSSPPRSNSTHVGFDAELSDPGEMTSAGNEPTEPMLAVALSPTKKFENSVVGSAYVAGATVILTSPFA